MSTHVVYCRRAEEPRHVADHTDPAAIPITREMPGDGIASLIRPDGAIPYLFDGLRAIVPLPPLAAALLRQVDGSRTVADILAAVTQGGNKPETVRQAWRATFTALNRVNQLLLSPPP